MKLQLVSLVSLVGLGAGCVGGTASAGDVAGEATADVQLNTSLAKRRDHHPRKTPLERIAGPTRIGARLAGVTGGAGGGVHPQAVGSALQPNLTYRGGPMLESVQVYAVFWGPSVDANVAGAVPSFLGGIVGSASPINSMLAQYDTNGMSLGTGSYGGSISDDDAPIPSDGVITDEMIEAEGARLVDTGKVPAENGHNILMFFFPPGVAIDQGGGTMSCEVFCAYHSSFTRNGNNFFYGVIPDQNSGGCQNGCGLTKDPVRTTFSTSSHELIEAMTDAAVGAGDLAWYDDTWGEIGDVCIEWDGSSNNYYVQSEWSNADHGCTDHSATTSANIDVKYDDSLTTAPGANATFTINSTGNAAGTLQLETDGLPTGSGGFSPSFSSATPNVGGSATLSVGVPAGLRSMDMPFKLAATDSNGAHHFAQVTVHVKGAAPSIASADVTSAPSNGGTLVTLTGANFGVGAQAFLCDALPCTATALSKPLQGGYVGGTNGQTLQLVTPSHSAANSGGTTTHIVVMNPNDPTQASLSFKFTAGPSPTVTAISPAQGPIGGNTFVTITGSNFSSNSALHIGSAKLVAGQTFLVVDDKTIIALTPAVAAAGVQTVQVYNADGRSGKLAGGFNYGPNPPPVVGSLSVDNGPPAGGTYVTIFGDNFDPNATVSFGGTAATVKTANPSFLGVFAPAHAAGTVDVVVTNADGLTATSSFTYGDATGGGSDGGVDDGGDNGGGHGGGGAGGGDGTSGGTGGNGNNPGNTVGGNHIDASSGCSMGSDGGSAPSLISLVVVLAAFGFALRRQRS